MSRYFSVSEAAEKLGVSPWEVADLTESGHIDSVVLVAADSLAEYVYSQQEAERDRLRATHATTNRPGTDD